LKNVVSSEPAMVPPRVENATTPQSTGVATCGSLVATPGPAVNGSARGALSLGWSGARR
jgi:hypothetical protein